MGKDQEIIDAGRTGNIPVIHKIFNQKKKSAALVSQITGAFASLRRLPNINCQDANGDTALHLAALNGHADMVRILLQYEANPNVVDSRGCLPLHLAAWSGHSEICQDLLTLGPQFSKPDEQNHEGETAILSAAQYGHTQVVNVLLTRGADCELRNHKGESPLDLACQYGRLDTVRLLLTKCPDLVAKGATDSSSALHLAARNGHLQIVQLLVQCGANLNALTDAGSALHEAAVYGKEEVVNYLLRQGIDVYLKDSNDRTAIEVLSDQKSQKSLNIGTAILDHLERLGLSPTKPRPASSTLPFLPGAQTRPVSELYSTPDKVVQPTARYRPRESVTSECSTTSTVPGSSPPLPERHYLRPISDPIYDVPRPFSQSHDSTGQYLESLRISGDHSGDGAHVLSKSHDSSAYLRTTPPPAPPRTSSMPHHGGTVTSESSDLEGQGSLSQGSLGSLTTSEKSAGAVGARSPQLAKHGKPKKPPRGRKTIRTPPPSVSEILDAPSGEQEASPKSEELANEEARNKAEDSVDRSETEAIFEMDEETSNTQKPHIQPPSTTQQQEPHSNTTTVMQPHSPKHAAIRPHVHITTQSHYAEFPVSNPVLRGQRSWETDPFRDEPVHSDHMSLLRTANNNKTGAIDRNSKSSDHSSRPTSLEVKATRDVTSDDVSTECTSTLPLSPTGYPQPPTPDFPPPSPATALEGVHLTIERVKEKRRSQEMQDGNSPENEMKRNSRDVQTLTDKPDKPDCSSSDTSPGAPSADSASSGADRASPESDASTSETGCVLRKKSTTRPEEMILSCHQDDPFRGLNKGALPANQRRIKTQLYDHVIVHPVAKHRLSSQHFSGSVTSTRSLTSDPAVKVARSTDLDKDKKTSNMGNTEGTTEVKDKMAVGKVNQGHATTSQGHSDETKDKKAQHKPKPLPKPEFISNKKQTHKSEVHLTINDSKSKDCDNTVMSKDSSSLPAPPTESLTENPTENLTLETGSQRANQQAIPIEHTADVKSDTLEKVDNKSDVNQQNSNNDQDKDHLSNKQTEERVNDKATEENVYDNAKSVIDYDSKEKLQPVDTGTKTAENDTLTTELERDDPKKADCDVMSSHVTSSDEGPIPDTQNIMDDSEEWAQIAGIMASFGGGIARESVFIKDFEAKFTQMLSESGNMESVGDWLDTLGLPQYENLLIPNGFDHMEFMGPDVVEQNDLIQIGVTDPLHIQTLLDACAQLPTIKHIGDDPVPSSVGEWLSSIELGEYTQSFLDQGYDSIDKLSNIWELELNSVMDMVSVGHRKRMLASLRSPPSGQLISTNDKAGCASPPTQEEPPPISCAKPGQRYMNSADTGEDSVFKDYTLTRRKEVARDLPIRPPNQSSAVSQWRHRPEVLIRGCCNYTAQYLGSTHVSNLAGLESTKVSITKMKKSTSGIGKIPSINLSISYKGVKFIDSKSKRVVCEHEISNIFCACQDGDDLEYFAYITKDLQTKQHYCHVFTVHSTELAAEIILTLGEAFEVAYQMAIKEQRLPALATNQTPSQSSQPAVNHSAPSHTSSESAKEKKTQNVVKNNANDEIYVNQTGQSTSHTVNQTGNLTNSESYMQPLRQNSNQSQHSDSSESKSCQQSLPDYDNVTEDMNQTSQSNNPTSNLTSNQSPPVSQKSGTSDDYSTIFPTTNSKPSVSQSTAKDVTQNPSTSKSGNTVKPEPHSISSSSISASYLTTPTSSTQHVNTAAMSTGYLTSPSTATQNQGTSSISASHITTTTPSTQSLSDAYISTPNHGTRILGTSAADATYLTTPNSSTQMSTVNSNTSYLTAPTNASSKKDITDDVTSSMTSQRVCLNPRAPSSSSDTDFPPPTCKATESHL